MRWLSKSAGGNDREGRRGMFDLSQRQMEKLLQLSGPRSEGKAMPDGQDMDTLAYLWMGLDAGLSVLVSGTSANSTLAVVSALVSLIHPRRKLAVIEKRAFSVGLESKILASIGLYGRIYGITAEKRIGELAMDMPDRIIIDEMGRHEARKLFSTASRGIPFIAGMPACGGPFRILEYLTAKKTGMGVGDLCSLDLLVLAGASGRICSVFDYDWLSKAEAGEYIEMGGDGVNSRKMSDGKSLDMHRFPRSKVARRFGMQYGYSIDRCTSELKRRSVFLANTYPEGRFLSSDYVESARLL